MADSGLSPGALIDWEQPSLLTNRYSADWQARTPLSVMDSGCHGLASVRAKAAARRNATSAAGLSSIRQF